MADESLNIPRTKGGFPVRQKAFFLAFLVFSFDEL